MTEQVYDVFARVRRGDLLQEIGSVRAGSQGLARVYAELIFDEENFTDMMIVDRAAVAWVRRLPSGDGGGSAG